LFELAFCYSFTVSVNKQSKKCMKVTFTKTADRRYRVSVDGTGVEPSYIEPAPGYDPKLPHDAAHFIVERELDIKGGIFGQLASGGRAGTFRSDSTTKRRKTLRRDGKILSTNRDDALFSEHAVHIACSKWKGEEAAYDPIRKISPDEIDKICRAFDEFSQRWSKLRVGESITLEWTDDHQKHQANHRR
jgi:hypothetical protein